VEARYYKKLKNKTVGCFLCRHNCTIKPKAKGICKVRVNENGKLVTVVYGRPCSIAVDPIEKKPLYHFMPGELSLSYATTGCNFSCMNCQNWQISQNVMVDYREVKPEEMVSIAVENKAPIIAHTYTEPTVFFEYAFDIAKLSSKKGIKNVFVTNGYIEHQPLKDIAPYLDAANIDLKAFNEKFYKKVCGAQLGKVLKTIKLYKKLKIWIEVTNLVIPGYNDDADEIESMCEWIKENCGAETPLHFSSYFPNYRMKAPRTPVELLEKAYIIAKESGLKYVYLGNVRSDKSNTCCWKCGELIIERTGFHAGIKVKGKRCPRCGSELHIVF
jgi:pyruvate formate lyase activating enzyme